MRRSRASQKQIAIFETQVVESLTESEVVEKELEERADEINTLDAKRDVALGEFDAEMKKYKTELNSETKHRKTTFETLPARLASIYDRMAQRSRDGVAVAEVIGGACSACYMSLRPQVQLNVKKGDEIITCENCTRILYLPSREAEATA
jgi:predicted  nucleic acid-binding Zn-ribbon protein